MKPVFKALKRDRGQSLLQSLHWLPIQVRTDKKLSSICHNLSDSSAAYLFELTVYASSRQFCSSADRYFVPLCLKKNTPLASAVTPTILQSDGVCSLLTSVTFSSPLGLQKCLKNSPLRTIPQQVISDLFSYLHVHPPLLTPCYIPSVCPCVCMGVAI